MLELARFVAPEAETTTSAFAAQAATQYLQFNQWSDSNCMATNQAQFFLQSGKRSVVPRRLKGRL